MLKIYEIDVNLSICSTRFLCVLSLRSPFVHSLLPDEQVAMMYGILYHCGFRGSSPHVVVPPSPASRHHHNLLQVVLSSARGTEPRFCRQRSTGLPQPPEAQANASACPHGYPYTVAAIMSNHQVLPLGEEMTKTAVSEFVGVVAVLGGRRLLLVLTPGF